MRFAAQRCRCLRSSRLNWRGGGRGGGWRRRVRGWGGPPAAGRLELSGVSTSTQPVADFHTLTANSRSTRAIIDAVNVIASVDFCERPERAFEIRYTPAEALVLPASATDAPSGI